MADAKRLRRLVLTVKAGDSLCILVSTGQRLIVRRDLRDPNKFLFEEFTALAEKPYFRISRKKSAPSKTSAASQENGAAMNEQVRLRRLVLKVAVGEAVFITVSNDRLLVVRRDAQKPNRLVFEEFTALTEKPYFRITREHPATITGDRAVSNQMQHRRRASRFGNDAQAGL